MAKFNVIIQPEAERDFRAVPFPFRRQLNQKIYALKDEPRPPESEIILDELRVVRVAGWRLLYEIDETTTTFTVLAVLPPVG